jgi:hypothetical protein
MARTYPKVATPLFEPPADYDGPLYYRIRSNLTWPHPNWFWREKGDADLYPDIHSRYRTAPARDEFVSENGVLLPVWQRPQRYHFLPDKMPHEFHDPILSERIHDIIETLAPGRHVFLPLDFIAPEGKTIRWYYRVRHLTAFPASPPPALHTEINGLKSFRYEGGAIGFKKPEWGWSHADQHHFGYLNETLVSGLHIFETELLDNDTVLSASLFESLRGIGDQVLHRRDEYWPMGSAPHDPPPGGYRCDNDPSRRTTLVNRWKRLLKQR